MSISTPPLLEARDITKRYTKGDQEVEVLKGASLSVETGEMVAVVGASGSGKSTLLHILGSLDQPTEGSVCYEGANLADMSEPALADFRNRSLGFVFQFHHLLADFDALENVMMPGLVRGLSRKEAKSLAAEAMESVAMTHRMTHRPGELSGGEQQRVALARAIVLRPKLLLADEVSGNLDQETGTEIHRLLGTLNQDQGLTMVIVTHNAAWADQIPRRLVLRSGQVMEPA